MTKNERLHLESLSQKLYGNKSKYLKMVTKGEKAPMEEIMEDGISRKYTGIHYSTMEEIKKLMEDLVKEDEDQKAREELEMEALKQAESIKENAGGKDDPPHDTIKEILETVGD